MSKTFHPSEIIGSNDEFIIGKYRGKTVQNVMDFDPYYIDWMRSKPWAKECHRFMELTNDVSIGDISWGKYKGKTLQWIMDNDESYMRFLFNSEYVRTKCPELKKKIDAIYI